MRVGSILAALAIGLAPGAAFADAAQTPDCAAAAAYSEAHDGLALLILQDGKPVCEAYHQGTAPNDAHPLFSGTKSFAAAMAVLAEQDGLLALDEPVSKTLTEWRDGTSRETITLRQLLSLVSGIAGVVGRPPSYAEAVALTPQSAPGSNFAYGPAPFQIFGEVLRRKLAERQLHEDPATWAQRRLFDPIGLKVAQWRRTPDGNPLMPQGLVLTAADWARFGEWVRLDGIAGGRALVSPEHLAAFYKGSEAFPGYGLGWWLPMRMREPEVQARLPRAAGRLDFSGTPDMPGDMLMAAGAGDQRLYVSKLAGITVVRFARFTGGRAMRPETGDAGWSDGAFLRLAMKAAHGRKD